MSSLLDVLHKRQPYRPVEADPVPEEAGGSALPAEVDGSPALELTLAAETRTVTAAALPAEDDPPSPTDSAAPECVGGAMPARRRGDPAPAVASPIGDRRRWRHLLSMLLLGSLVLATGIISLQFRALSTESILAEPDLSRAPLPMAATNGARPMTGDEPPAESVATPSTARSPAPQADTGEGEVAWYDQPALPEEPLTSVDPQPTGLIRITRGMREHPLPARLREAYAALRSGDLVRSEALYREVLEADARSIDALLGLGVIAARDGRVEEARALYLQVRTLDPKNAVAAASLSALSGSARTTDAESRLKHMLREQPDSAPLHFALGVHHAGERRWADAQEAFFEAVRHEPQNADYAFNLAVSLDHLGQHQAAASYYQRAVELAGGAEEFDPQIARARLIALRGPRG